MRSEETRSRIREALSGCRIVVMDEQTATSERLLNYFAGLTDVSVAKVVSEEQARKAMQDPNPAWIFCGKRFCGFDAIEWSWTRQQVGRQMSDRFFVMTEDNLETEDSLPLEGDVSLYIMKPIVGALLDRYLLATARGPSEAERQTQELWNTLQLNTTISASTWSELSSLAPSPTRELLMAKAHVRTNNIPEARAHLTAFRRAHPNSPRGKEVEIHVLMIEQKLSEAMPLALDLVCHHPWRGDTLALSLKVAVGARDLDAIEELIRVGSKRSPDVQRRVTLASGLAAAAKIAWHQRDEARSIGFWDRAAAMAPRTLEMMESAIDFFLGQLRPDLAGQFLDRISPAQIPFSIVRCARYRLLEKLNSPADRLAGESRDLILAGHADLYVCLRGLEWAQKRKNHMLMETLLQKAVAQYPDDREQLLRACEGPIASQSR